MNKGRRSWKNKGLWGPLGTSNRCCLLEEDGVLSDSNVLKDRPLLLFFFFLLTDISSTAR